MVLRFWHQGSGKLPTPKQRQSSLRLRPCLEALEDRTLLNLDFNSALNLDTYPWVRLHPGDPLLPQAPPGKYNWTQARHPDSIAIGDFTGNGIPDIAVADFNSDPTAVDEGEISIFLGGVRDFGTSSGANTATTLNDTSKNWLSNQWAGLTVRILGGTGAGQTQTITSNTPNQLTLSSAWSTVPDGSSSYQIEDTSSGLFTHTQPIVDLTTNPQRIGLLDSGGIAPKAIVAARLRGPNAPLDLIVANQGIDGVVGANVSILLGNGDGTFQAPVRYDAGIAPTALAVGDFNGDGNLDVVVADRTFLPGTATVLFGNGNGGFSSSTSLGLFDASIYPESVAVGDFGNGHLDFVTANSGSDNVTVVLGNGDGTFSSAVTYGTDTAPVSVAVADLLGNGKLDIVTANNGGDDVSILLGNGDGTFPAFATLNFPAGLTPTSVVVGNFDGAGPGLAVTNGQDSAASSNAVAILRFNPNHNLPDDSDLLFPPTFYRTGQLPVAVAAAQLRPSVNVLDLVVANFGSTLDRGSVNVLLGRAIAEHGQFYPSPGIFPTDLQPDSVAVGDFNGDGLPDFVAANSVTNDLTVWLDDPNAPGNNFLPLTDANGNLIALNPVGINPKKVVVGDFNGDGRPDIAVADFGDFGVAQGSVTVFLNTGKQIGPDGNPLPLFVNDPNFATLTVARPDVYLLDMATGDFNGDGKLDVAVLFFNAVTGRFGIAVLFGDGKGNLTLGPDTLLPIGTNPTSIAVGDFKGDGKADIAVTNFKDLATDLTLGILFGNGDGTFQDPVSYHAGTHVSAVAVGRLRGKDQPVDIVVTNENFPGGVTVFLNNGDGTFPDKGTTYFAGTNPISLVIADLNGDGIPDIAVANVNGDSVSVLFGNPKSDDPTHGDGTFANTVAYVTGGFPLSIAAADFFNHADGRLDLITADSASNDVAVLENTQPPPMSPAPPPGGGAATPRLGQGSGSNAVALSERNQSFVALEGTDQAPAMLAGQSDAWSMMDPWQTMIRRRRMDDNEMVVILLWEKN